MRKRGNLERWLLPSAKVKHQMKVKLTPEDPPHCVICHSALGTDTKRCTDPSEDTCQAVRLQPCGHVVGLECFNAWLEATHGATPTCLQCTRPVVVNAGQTQRVLRRIFLTPIRMAEKALLYSICIVILPFWLIYDMCESTMNEVKKYWKNYKRGKKQNVHIPGRVL